MKKLISMLLAAMTLFCTSLTAMAEDAASAAESGGFDPMWIVIAIVIGLIISFITMMVHKSALKTVRSERAAANYIKQGSVDINVRRETYLYKKVDRREKPKDENK